MAKFDIQEELEILIKEVIDKKDRIIPVIGDDCFMGYVDENGIRDIVTLQEWIAVKVLGANNKKRKKISSEGYRGLDILFEEYVRIYKKGFLTYRDKINFCVNKGIDEEQIFLRKDVKDFLNAAKFKVIATTCPFQILEKELDSFKYNVSSFSPASPKSELDFPTVYKIFGDSSSDIEFVLGEEDLLKFLHYLNRSGAYKCTLAQYIEKIGEDGKGLGMFMPIGCNNLPNWLFRFLWYPFSYKCLTSNQDVNKDSNQGGIWHKHSTDKCFHEFLCKYGFKTFSNSTDVMKDNKFDGYDPVLNMIKKKFVNIERSIQEEVEKLGVQGKNNWDIFISYASEDINVAQFVYEILTIDCKKKVWLDKRGQIKGGDMYWDAIKFGIEHSQKFVFIITESYLKKAIDKSAGVNEELKWIKYHFLRKRIDGQGGYSIPIILDGTKVTYTQGNDIHKNEILVSGAFEQLYQ